VPGTARREGVPAWFAHQRSQGSDGANDFLTQRTVKNGPVIFEHSRFYVLRDAGDLTGNVAILQLLADRILVLEQLVDKGLVYDGDFLAIRIFIRKA
jgi:hypothetical protein